MVGGLEKKGNVCGLLIKLGGDSTRDCLLEAQNVVDVKICFKI